jgi:hypothetical protein
VEKKMRILEKIIKWLLYAYLIYSFLVLFFLWEYTNPKVVIIPADGYSLLGVFVYSAFCIFIFPLWDVRKHLNTLDPEEVIRFKKKYKFEFSVIFFGFFGVLCLTAPPQSPIWFFGLIIFLLVVIWNVSRLKRA